MRTHFLRQAVRQWEDPTWLTVIHVKYDQSNQFRAVLREHRLIVAVEKHRWRGARWVPAGGALPGGDGRGRRRAVTRAPPIAAANRHQPRPSLARGAPRCSRPAFSAPRGDSGSQAPFSSRCCCLHRQLPGSLWEGRRVWGRPTRYLFSLALKGHVFPLFVG